SECDICARGYQGDPSPTQQQRIRNLTTTSEPGKPQFFLKHPHYTLVLASISMLNMSYAIFGDADSGDRLQPVASSWWRSRVHYFSRSAACRRSECKCKEEGFS